MWFGFLSPAHGRWISQTIAMVTLFCPINLLWSLCTILGIGLDSSDFLNQNSWPGGDNGLDVGFSGSRPSLFPILCLSFAHFFAFGLNNIYLSRPYIIFLVIVRTNLLLKKNSVNCKHSSWVESKTNSTKIPSKILGLAQTHASPKWSVWVAFQAL